MRPSSLRHRVLAGALLLGALLLRPAPALRAQQNPGSQAPTIKIVGSGRQKVPIAIPPFDGGEPAAGRETGALLHDVVRDDLLFSGFFQMIPDDYLKLVSPFNDRKANYKEWAGIGANALLVGVARPGDAGELTFEGRVYDTNEQRMVLGKRYRAGLEEVRLLAHRMSDEIVLQYTSHHGIATTRIAYVSQVGKGKEIFVMDYDGARPKRVTANGSINLSPSWSPDGRKIAFVSYKSGHPELMIMTAEGEIRSAFPQKGELNSAPAWSPDGRLLAFSSSRDGNAEIYTLAVADGSLRRLTSNDAIDTSPSWSIDGASIAFTSDRTGSPQIWVMDPDGGNARRVSESLSYCDAASWSPNPEDSGRLAFAARVPGGFDIYSLDVRSGQLTRLTNGEGINEWPRWSPDGRHLAFASNRSGSYDVYTMDADGDHVRRLTRGGNNTSPSWSR